MKGGNICTCSVIICVPEDTVLGRSAYASSPCRNVIVAAEETRGPKLADIVTDRDIVIEVVVAQLGSEAINMSDMCSQP